MKKFIYIAVVALVPFWASANPTDQWSVGRSTTVGNDSLRLLDTGDLVPGVDNAYNLGQTSASWKNADIQGIATIGRVVASTQALDISYIALIEISTTITPRTSFISLQSSAGVVYLTTLPSISTGSTVPDNMLLVLTSTITDTTRRVVFTDDNTLNGSSLELGAATREVGGNDVLILRYLAPVRKWVEQSFSNND